MSKHVKMAVKGAAFASVDEFVWFQGKLKTLPEENYKALKKSILKLGFSYALNIWINPEGKLILIDGHQRVLTLKRMRDEGYEVPFVAYDAVEAENYEEAKQKVLAGVAQYGKVEAQGMADFLADIQFDPIEFNSTFVIPEIDFAALPQTKEISVSEHMRTLGSGEPELPKPTISLAEKFTVAPFSVLNAREGWWQDRKRSWLSLGIKSEAGRGGNLLGMSNTVLEPDPEKRKKMLTGEAYEGGNAFSGAGTSIFDPVLCELGYSWFSPKDGVILDPFAGGSVRGIVASKLSRRYFGQDLSPLQVEENKKQAKEICDKETYKPSWTCGDSKTIRETHKDLQADLIFSCPPYADLEQYSDDPRDISSMEYPEFKKAYFEIIKESCALLKEDRFAMFTVGEVRDKKGIYYNFVGDTIQAFQEAGLKYYNEIILVTSVGTLPIRAGRTFSSTRKIGKTHQNVLIFVKGDGRKAAEACGTIEVYLPPME